MFKLTIEGPGLNFTMDIGNVLAKEVIGIAIDKRMAPMIRPMLVQDKVELPATEHIKVDIPETQQETEQDGEPP